MQAKNNSLIFKEKVQILVTKVLPYLTMNSSRAISNKDPQFFNI